ncbi:MAG: tRNA uridine-5-carboxymethylaminomethyl(34) synthesis enzyme MnmG [bacterium]
MNRNRYDVIVVGAGHAGIESALAASRLGCSTLLLTGNLDTVGWMPCNPAMGGPGKGHLVREIDALGGEIGRATDLAYVHIRVLNSGKGIAVRAYRAQVEKKFYHIYMKEKLENTPNLSLRQAYVTDILTDGKRVIGVRTKTNQEFYAKAVVITTGTFLGGKVFIGTEVSYPAGRMGEPPSEELTGSLRNLGFRIGRFKTGTPPRVDGRTVDYSKMTEQPPSKTPLRFSYRTDLAEVAGRKQLSCWLTFTTERTRKIVIENLDRAPMYSGQITGTGTRYCPSFETKVVHFPHRERHQVFIEPEGLHTNEMYVQGMYTSLPEEVQIELLHSIPGLEEVEIMRPGYAIEYDMVYPDQLKETLETKIISGLFLAGQINGTSGYEEAGAQGVIAGINAALYVQERPPFYLTRNEAYIGVLIDDLITKGIVEPYRILTSRAEYRLTLMQDNADERLMEKGFKLGLIDETLYKEMLERWELIEEEIRRLKRLYISELKTSAYNYLKRPEVTYSDLMGTLGMQSILSSELVDRLEAKVKYEGYIKREEERMSRFSQLDNKVLPEGIDYRNIKGLSLEARDRLSQVKPRTLGQASRLQGVSPADIDVLLVYLELYKREESKI